MVIDMLKIPGVNKIVEELRTRLPQVEESNYIVYQDEAEYRVKNGMTGQLEISTADPLEALSYAVNNVTSPGVITVRGVYNLDGRVLTINKQRITILGYGAIIRNGGIKLDGAHGTYIAGFRFENGATGVPCIHRYQTNFSVIADITMANVDIGIVEESETREHIVNRAYNIEIFFTNTVGVRFKNAGVSGAGNNLNVYYGLFIFGNPTANGVEIVGPDPANPLADGNVFFGLWAQGLNIGIKYDNGRSNTFFATWFEANQLYDIDIGEGGYMLMIYAPRLWGSSLPSINNPYNHNVMLIDFFDSWLYRISPSYITPKGAGPQDMPWYGGSGNNLVMNIPRGHVLQIWQNNANDGELRIHFDATTRRGFLYPMTDGGLKLGFPARRVYSVVLKPQTELPTSPAEGETILYFDGTVYKICSYLEASWKCAQLQ